MNRQVVCSSYVVKRCLSSSGAGGQLVERKSFGSFHSEHIDVLLRQTQESFRVPEIVDEIKHKVLQRFPILKQGRLDLRDRDAWRSLFFTEPSWTFLNHGAFGGALRPILYESQLYREYCESQPLRFYDRDYFPLLAHSLRQMGDLLHIPAPTNSPDNSPLKVTNATSKPSNTSLSPTLLPINNVTSGLNAIMNTYAHVLQPSDTIAYLSLTYGSTKKMFLDLSLRTGCKLKEIPLSLPIPSQAHLIESILSNITPETKLIVLDEITSNTALHLPIHTLAPLIKTRSEQNCAIIVDAAHSLFTRNVHIGRGMGTTNNNHHGGMMDGHHGVDYWLTNGHKWLCNAKGAGLMYVFHPVSSSSSSNTASTSSVAPVVPLRPPIISHGYLPSTTSSLFPAPAGEAGGFSWGGCSDPSPHFTLPSAFNIWQELAGAAVSTGDGLEVYRSYLSGLMDEFETSVKEAWGLRDEDFAAPKELRTGLPMRLIPLPPYLQSKSTVSNCSDVDAFTLQELLHHEYRIEVPVKCLGGRLYVRVSVHVYNDRRDLDRLMTVIRGLI